MVIGGKDLVTHSFSATRMIRNNMEKKGQGQEQQEVFIKNLMRKQLPYLGI